MKLHSRLTALTLTIPIAGLALTGCAAAGTNLSLVPSAPAQAASPSAPATPIAIEGDTDHNGSLSAFEKEQLTRNAPKDFTMPDGSVVKIDPTKPLPEPVKAVIAEEAVPIAAQFTGTDISVAGPAVENVVIVVE